MERHVSGDRYTHLSYVYLHAKLLITSSSYSIYTYMSHVNPIAKALLKGREELVETTLPSEEDVPVSTTVINRISRNILMFLMIYMGV